MSRFADLEAIDTKRFGTPSESVRTSVEARLPLLITGIAGVPGYNAYHYFRVRYPGQVIGERREDQWPLSGPDIVGCDLDDERGMDELFEKYQFRAVLSCGGSCRLKSCEMDPQRAARVNVESVRNLLRVTKGTNVRFIHTSIDLVFAGRSEGDYVESDPTDPVTVYGKTMVAAEELIMDQRPDSAILRISLPMGVSFNGHAGAIDWIQSRFLKDKPATLYYDEVRTPTYTDCLNQLYERLLVEPLSGIYHAGGTRRLSLYEIAQIVNRIGGFDPDLLLGCPRIDAGPMPPRAGNVTLNSDKLHQALGDCPFDAWPICDTQVPLDRDWHYDRTAPREGSVEQIANLLYQNPSYRPKGLNGIANEEY